MDIGESAAVAEEVETAAAEVAGLVGAAIGGREALRGDWSHQGDRQLCAQRSAACCRAKGEPQ